MWLQSTDDLRIEDIGVVAEQFTEEEGKAPSVARQIEERLKQHALLVNTRTGHWIGFDHEDFRQFYLGFALGWALVKRDVTIVKSIFEVTTLPRFAADQAANYVRKTGGDRVRSVLELLQDLASRDSIVSFVRENCGSLTIALVDTLDANDVIASQMSFPVDALCGRSLWGLEVLDSHFSNTSLEGAKFVGCTFRRCQFERLEGLAERIDATGLLKCTVASLVYQDEDPEYGDIELYDPSQIRQRLLQNGFGIEDSIATQSSSVEHADDMSSDLKLVQRVLRTITLFTRVNESTLQIRLGRKFSRFEKEILPKLLSAGVLGHEKREGRQDQRCLRMAMPMRQIEDAMTNAVGEFECFIDSLSK